MDIKSIETNKRKSSQKKKKSSVLDLINKYWIYISVACAIFCGGYATGVYITELRNMINNIKTNGEYQKEHDQLRDKIINLENEMNLYKFSNPGYATKEELEELKKNMEKFTNRQINRSYE